MRRLTARVGWLLPAVITAAMLGLPGCRVVRGDVFLLENGGRIHGRWLNRRDGPAATYEIQTPYGGRVILAASQVRQTIRRRWAEVEYGRIASSFADSVPQQWRLAEWCREHRLPEQRAVHLRRIVQLEPEHAPARRGLGYTMIGGQWITKDQWRKKEGLRYYRGRWRIPQEIELFEQRRSADVAEKEWLARLRRWRDDLGKEQSDRVEKNIMAVRDPLAVKGLVQLLRQEPYRAVKLLFVEAMAGIDDGAAIEALIQTSLIDPDVEVRLACVDRIVRMERPQAVSVYVKALAVDENRVVNRAAVALGRLGDESAIGPLIDALVTTHRITLTPPRSPSPDAMTTTFVSPNGPTGVNAPVGAFPQGTGFSTGRRTTVIPLQVPNQDVLGALIVLADGVNFSFDERAWRYWHAAQLQRETHRLNARRDAPGS